MLKSWLMVLGCLVIAVLSGCWEKSETTLATGPIVAEADSPFHSRLREIALTYPQYGRVDDPIRWALADCVVPPAPAGLRASASKDTQTHGRKLYSLFAKFGAFGFYASKVGQVVVKESWLPEEVVDKGQPLDVVSRKVKVRAEDAKDGTKTVAVEDRYVPYARRDGHLYHAAKRGPLFIMFKMDPKTPDTDEGWVYGTVTADGQEVTSAGRVESCMNCHQKAPHDRLFGLPQNGSPTAEGGGR